MLKITNLARPEFKANPYPFYARLRAEAAAHRTKFLGQPTWLVTRYDDVVSILKDDRFVKDWLPRTKWIHRVSGAVTSHMLNKDGPDHMRLRTLVHKAFTPSLVERLRERIQSICDDLLNELTVNLRKLIAERRREPRDDLITALAQAEEAGDKLSERELVATIALLLIAGYETTVNLIGNGALALIQNRQQRESFQQNPSLGDSAIEELLRYTSPLDIASQRFAREEVLMDSVTIQQGQIVIAMLGSANHDENQFRDPEVLDLTREPNRHVAFGQGAHFCVGAPLARIEGQIALTTLFRRFPQLRLALEPESLRWRKSLIVRGLEELPVESH